MAFTIKTFNTTKRKNSTLIPTGGEDITVVLKNSTSVIAPTFLLNASEMPSFSMVMWGNRYYFVTDISAVRNNLYEIRCAVDVLATYKSQILAQSLYIAYASVGGNALIYDTRIAALANLQVHSAAVDFADYGRCYILAVIGGGSRGFTSYYVISSGELRTLAEGLTTDSSVIAELRELYNNPLDAIVSLWESAIYPVGTQSSVISIGSISADGEMLTLGRNTTTQSISIPWQYSDFRRLPPFSTMSLELPFVGVVELSTSDFLNVNTLYVTYTVDYYTGDVLYQIKNSETGNAIATFSGNCYSQIPVAAIQRNWQGYTTGVMDTVKNIATAITSGGEQGIGGIIGGLAQTASGYFTKTYSLSGGQGGGTKFTLSQIKLNMYTRGSNIEPTNLSPCVGRPVMAVQPLSGKTGYIQTVGASVPIPGFDSERQQLNAFLDGGVYIE